jgi:hypothetical protein
MPELLHTFFALYAYFTLFGILSVAFSGRTLG